MTGHRTQNLSIRLLAPFFALAVLGAGCVGGMQEIDARTERLLRQGSDRIGADHPPPLEAAGYPRGDALSFPDDDDFSPETVNPRAEEIEFVAADSREEQVEEEAAAVLDRLEQAGDEATIPADAASPTSDALALDIARALALAQEHSREYRSAEEEYILASLRLLIERHLWGPRFFDEMSATAVGSADGGSFDSALQLVNELAVTQRLPYGGEVSARLLARATEDLRELVAGENVQTAELVLNANLPLLRGAGLAARDSRIQAERDLIYAAREFETFRREFLVDVATEFLGLVVQQRSIANAETRLLRLQEFLDREEELLNAGRSTRFEAAQVAQDVLFAEDDLRSARESYRFAVDRFKVRLGLPVDEEIVIVPSSLGLPTPAADDSEAVRMALAYRLDLQTERDQVSDALRQIDIAKNELLPDLNLAGSFSIPTDEGPDRAGLKLDGEESSFAAGVTFGLPLDREVERLNLRQAQISAERAQRDYTEFRDNIVVEVRDAVREIGRALFSLELQEENIGIARLRLESIEAAPDRATARDRSEAADALTEALDERDAAIRDLEVAILNYLLNTGTLRVRADGTIEPLAGMNLNPQIQDENRGGG
jgi:outer membrane protein TolC